MLPKATILASTLVLFAPCQAQELPAATAQPQLTQFSAGNATVKLWQENGTAKAAVSRDGARTWSPLQDPDHVLHFVYAQYDPLVGELTLPGRLGASPQNRIFVVQFKTQILAEYRQAIDQLGEVVGYIPEDAYLVRADRGVAAAMRGLPCVRWVGDLQVAFKLESQLHNVAAEGGDGAPVEYNVVLANKAEHAALAAQVAGLGGKVTLDDGNGTYLSATLTPVQLAAVAALDTVVWVDRTTPTGTDMNNARIQGGANYLETQAGMTGQGVRGEISEGFEHTHVDFQPRTVLIHYDGVEDHGHCTAGIVFGDGSSAANARGMLPDAQPIKADYNTWMSSITRTTLLQQTANPALAWKGMFQTGSWGNAQTPAYTSVSQDMDNGIYTSDLPVTQSMSNLGNQNARPQAWAKNVISVGGVFHHDNPNPLDDNWGGGGSIGPAADGRIKPEICAYYDLVWTSDRTGSLGYNTAASPGGDSFTGFNGTSSATPIVAGHVGLILQMQTDGIFGNPLPLPAVAANRFQNRPHFTSTKALLVNTAKQYTFSGTTADLARMHVGWGFPNVQTPWDYRKKLLVVDEYDVLQQGQSRTYIVWVPPGQPEFVATMVYADPAALPSANPTRINNLDLKVTRLSTGTFWYGNNGLTAGNYSTSGGTADTLDTCEMVILQNPVSDIYLVQVTAASVVQDQHLETPQMDADFSLVVRPLGGFHNDTGMSFDLVSTAPGDCRAIVSNVPAAGWVHGYTFLSFTTTKNEGFGKFFGLEDDGLTGGIYNMPATPGDVFHFTNAGAGSYPFTPYTFAPGIVLALTGLRVDGQVTLFDAAGGVAAQSNVKRVTLM